MTVTASLRALLVGVLVVGAAAAAPASADAAPSTAKLLRGADTCRGLDREDLSVRAQVRVMRCLVNHVRSRAGRSKLRVDRRLVRSARFKNRLMVRCDDFSHEPCGKAFGTVFRKAKYRGYSYGENLAWGNGRYGTPRSIMTSWLNSSGHRANLLSRRWKEQGLAVRIGRFQGTSGVVLWTSQFGRS